MRIAFPRMATIVAAGATAATLGLAPSAHAGSDGKDCRDSAAVSVCQKPGHSSISPSAPDLATQQLLGGNPPNPLPPAALG